MCGICGVVAFDGSPVRSDDVTAMTSLLHHRGPDDRGTWSSHNIALGATRLSILDLSQAGHQPMTSGDWTLVYNGEIYNHRAIRARLDVPFRSHSDTEVVLESIRAWGAEAIAEFDGMFALAAWDERTRTLLLARDRFGIKPLYYARVANELAFASEARALVAWRRELAEVRDDAIEEYLTFRDVAGEATLYRRIQRVLPGTVLQFTPTSEGRTPSSAHAASAALTRGRADALVRPSIVRAVCDQLVADVPVGTLCSGGIDSGLLTVLAAREHNAPLHSFSVAFPGFALDESHHAAAIAKRAGTIHHTVPFDRSTLAEDIVTLTRHHDEPLMHPNSIALYQVCRFARENGVIVLLAGEGADELFGGYARYASARKLARVRRWQHVPFTSRIRWGRVPLPNRLRAIGYKLTANADDLVMYGTAMTSASEVALLLGRQPKGEFAYRREVLARTRELDFVERVRQYDIDTYLPPLLVRQDKMSMAASVETRVPMLSNAVAAHALSLPARDKQPLRELANELLPHETVNRPKIGFNTPTNEWMQGDILSLLTSNPRVASYIDVRAIASAHGELLWTILALEVWLRQCTQ